MKVAGDFSPLWLFNPRRKARILPAHRDASTRGLTLELSGCEAVRSNDWLGVAMLRRFAAPHEDSVYLKQRWSQGDGALAAAGRTAHADDGTTTVETSEEAPVLR
jgi:hypothetical protein